MLVRHLANPAFEEARSYLHNTTYNSFKSYQRDFYKIIQHLNVDYFVLSITKEGREIPVGKLSTISIADEYVFTYSNDTRFISDFLTKIVNNEATLFYAQFGHIPTKDEMNILLDDVPYYAYLTSTQVALHDMEWIIHKTSHSRYFSERNREALDNLWQTLTVKQDRLDDILAKDPSRMTIASINVISTNFAE